jgi:uncharacterized phage protein (TIGR01671 family)
MSNRQIKFRVWDKQKKEWFPIKNAMCLILNPESTDLCFMTKQGPYPIPQTGQEDGGLNRFVIQQFTGLTDSTGKEIYEGDFFKSGTYKWDAVEFKDGKFVANLRGARFFDLCELLNDNVKPEVVGNVFENPELL